MATATPGPWSAVNNPSSNYGLEVIADVKVKAKRVVCRVSGPDRDANARLIAAAPELLAALKLLSAEERRDDDDPILISAREQARVAIAKATGGPS